MRWSAPNPARTLRFLSRSPLGKAILASAMLTSSMILASMFTSAAHAAPIYIGDAASQGFTFGSGGGPRADTVSTLTYVSTAPANRYTAPINQQVRITEVNFFADMGGVLTPFVGRYNGANNQLGSSYTVLAKGDPITVTPTGVLGNDATDHLVNASFLVAGVNPVLSLTAGDILVAGWLQTGTTGNIVYISNIAGSGSAEYIANGNTLTGAPIGGNLTGNSSFAFDRTMQFNVGLELVVASVPEPSSAAVWAAIGLGLFGICRHRLTRKK